MATLSPRPSAQTREDGVGHGRVGHDGVRIAQGSWFRTRAERSSSCILPLIFLGLAPVAASFPLGVVGAGYWKPWVTTLYLTRRDTPKSGMGGARGGVSGLQWCRAAHG
mgnify:CR=1 FL=1